MYRAIEFDDEPQFMTVKISDEKTLSPFVLVENRKLAVELKSKKVSISQYCPKLLLGWCLIPSQLPTPLSRYLS